jgi:hypothetical protein
VQPTTTTPPQPRWLCPAASAAAAAVPPHAHGMTRGSTLQLRLGVFAECAGRTMVVDGLPLSPAKPGEALLFNSNLLVWLHVQCVTMMQLG